MRPHALSLLLLSAAVSAAPQGRSQVVVDEPAAPSAAPAAPALSPSEALPAATLAQPALSSPAGSAPVAAPSASARTKVAQLSYPSGSTGTSASASMTGASGAASGLPGMGGLSPFGPGGMCGGPEHQELDKISTQNMIETQKSQQKLRPLNAEHDEIVARYGLTMDKHKLSLAPQEQQFP